MKFGLMTVEVKGIRGFGVEKRVRRGINPRLTGEYG